MADLALHRSAGHLAVDHRRDPVVVDRVSVAIIAGLGRIPSSCRPPNWPRCPLTSNVCARPLAAPAEDAMVGSLEPVAIGQLVPKGFSPNSARRSLQAPSSA